jgi:hypothetical protein
MSNSKKAFPKCWIQHRQILPILMEENMYTLNSKVRNAEHAIAKFPRLRDRERRPASDDVSPIGRPATNRLVPPPGIRISFSNQWAGVSLVFFLNTNGRACSLSMIGSDSWPDMGI